MNELRVAAITTGRKVPSARFRVRALIDELEVRGVAVDEFAPTISSYPPARRVLRPLWLAAALANRLPAVASSHRYDVTLIQRGLISTLYTLEGLTNAPRVLDVDDAIYLRRDGRAATKLARRVDLILCGNETLAEWFGQHQPNIAIIPTSIDTRRFKPPAEASAAPTTDADQRVDIGWTGSAANLPYLEAIEPALAQVLAQRPEARLAVMCDRRPVFSLLRPEQWCFEAWRSDREVAAVQQYAIGIMPLSDGPWERGKCAFKLLQYMACAKPVVASPVGVNGDLLAAGRIGYGATSNDEWIDALLALLDDASARRQMGAAGRALAEARYDTAIIAARCAAALRGVV